MLRIIARSGAKGLQDSLIDEVSGPLKVFQTQTVGCRLLQPESERPVLPVSPALLFTSEISGSFPASPSRSFFQRIARTFAVSFAGSSESAALMS
jgi:hypothetical protein